MESQKQFTPGFSCEFFPPKTDEGARKLRLAREQLAQIGPAYFSVTFGAGGSTQEGTFDTVVEIQQAGFEAAPHLSCIGSTRDNIRALLERYRKQGIRRIVALRGDMPSGMREAGEFQHANELVAFIREQTGDHFHIEVAAYPEFHPQAVNAIQDLEHFRHKVEAGADGAITQYFYNPYAYFRFVDDCERLGLALPIVPGIMPITNYTQLARFSDACGAEIPRWIRKRLEAYADDLDSIRGFGEEVMVELCQTLLDAGAPGLHFYTMNRAEPTLAIWKRLRL
ncbi:methylenetetrahydrofolate reductase [NAD(P)H] [Thiohalobacter sp. IOR34]|uniref:methylenetetrahydrofolate reductase [NAD(P)H] n=1 Tax=Thiohalobacter sp. IOR34 TaxID=3057176 RepID=UPI0025AF0269|nr:methylenetetrahydrofolate reductase [NAD(P)H] [Thiohalobacter sp. IOR34]WJW76793.1 methylenetetrahydrofolate reductase [NAD(P)H] [Thiohalobacter sp. IOR34]